MSNIKWASIFGFISAGLTTIVILISLGGDQIMPGLDALAFIDVTVVIVAALVLLILKSRIAAIVLFSHFVFSRIMITIADPDLALGGIIITIAFATIYFYGILGSFSYHKLIKEAKEQESIEQERE